MTATPGSDAAQALTHSKTTAGARRILTTADLPDEVKTAAQQLLEELARSAAQTEHQASRTPAPSRPP